MSAAGRQSIAAEIDQIIESIKSTGNTQYAGRYIFAGSKTTAPPYTPSGADAYLGDTAALQREIGPGVQVPLNVDGASVIGDGSTSGSLLATLRQISTDLKANNSTALQGRRPVGARHRERGGHDGAGDGRGAHEPALDRPLAAPAAAGVDDAAALARPRTPTWRKAAVNFSQQQAVYQAALKAGAQIIQPSLMDFLH